MSSSRIREDHYPMILEAKIQKQNQIEQDLDQTQTSIDRKSKRTNKEGDFVPAKEIVFQGSSGSPKVKSRGGAKKSFRKSQDDSNRQQ